jgi:hypothetical protein
VWLLLAFEFDGLGFDHLDEDRRGGQFVDRDDTPRAG